MTREKISTPRSRVTSALRTVWLRSRERAAALKRECYCCEECQRKQSVAKGKEVKLHVHHINGVDWSGIVDLVFERLLVDPSQLKVLCKECHNEHHVSENPKG